MRLVSNALE